MKYNTSDARALLTRVLKQIAEENSSNPNTTGIRSHINGIYSLEVNGEPVQWFYNEKDLLKFFIEKDKENDNRPTDTKETD